MFGLQLNPMIPDFKLNYVKSCLKLIDVYLSYKLEKLILKFQAPLVLFQVSVTIRRREKDLSIDLRLTCSTT